MHIESYQGLKTQESPRNIIVGLFPLGSCVISSRCRHDLYNDFAQIEVKAVGLFFNFIFYIFFIFEFR